MREALGLVEVHGWSPAMVILDAMEKAASVRLLQAELNDFYGVCLKVTGPLGNVRAALEAAAAVAQSLHAKWVSDLLAAPDPEARAAYVARSEFNPLIEQDAVCHPSTAGIAKERDVSQPSDFAIGFIETQGFTAVMEAIDTACKAASVEVLGREKLGGGYITVMIKGDVAAVNAAVEAGKAKVDGLGKLIAAHVIPRPSKSILSLLPAKASGPVPLTHEP